MRELFKALPLGLVLPVVIGAASVKPEDAASNISAWAHWLGFETVPLWLSSPTADNRVILAALASSAIYALLVWPVPDIVRRFRTAPSGAAAVEQTIAPIPINEASLGAYMWSSLVVKHLDSRIAEDAGVEVGTGQTIAFPMVEQAHILGVANVAVLDRLLRYYEDDLVRMSHYSRVGGNLTKGECVWYLFNALSAQLGREKFQEFNALLKNSSGIGAAVLTGYEQISTYATRKQRPPKWWQPAPDFNLIPIMEAAALARKNLEATKHGRQRAKNISPDQMLLSYCYTFMNEITIYGRKIELSVAKSEYRRPAPRFGKIIFEGDDPKLIPTPVRDANSSNMRRPEWDRLCVLRPEVLDFIKKAKNAKL